MLHFSKKCGSLLQRSLLTRKYLFFGCFQLFFIHQSQNRPFLPDRPSAVSVETEWPFDPSNLSYIAFFLFGQQDTILKPHFRKLFNQIVLLETVKKDALFSALIYRSLSLQFALLSEKYYFF